MQVAVFGATGRIGRQVTQQCLAAGHDLRALVRTPEKLTLVHPRLAVRAGELADAMAVRETVHGADAVISALGPSLRPDAHGTPVAEGTRRIVAAMQQEGVRRFVGIVTASIPDAHDRPSFRGRALPVMATLLFPNALDELRGMAAAVSGSGLDWTLARIISLTGRLAKGTVRAGFLGRDDVGWTITRADVAAFLVAQLDDDTYVKAAPVISN